MSTHDIIDNRDETLIDHMRRILDSTESARFAVGYFFLSGFQDIAGKLGAMEELRLLIGNTSTRETIEQLAEGYRRLELVAEAAEKQSFRRRAEARDMAEATARNVRNAAELMDQTDEAEAAIRTLVRLIEEKRLKVRVYTKGRMHAKAYIFNYGPVYDLFGQVKEREENGIGIVGSSNLTLAGVTHPTELNVVVHGNTNHAALVRWFDALWEEAEDFQETLMRELRQSWAIAQVTPYEIYLKTLYALVRDRLEGGEQEIVADSKIERKLTEFQKRAVDVVGGMIRDYGGAFAADVVGLGKSFIGAAIVKRQERAGRRPLIICPAALVEMWKDYNEAYELNAHVLSMGLVSDADRARELLDPERGKLRERNFVLVDESHNFRSPDTLRYGVMQRFMGTADRPCCFLTATPRNKSAWDVYHQIKLFHQDDKTLLPIDPPDLRQYFREIDKGSKDLKDLLSHVLYRRRRNDIIRHYGYDAKSHERLTEAQFKEYVADRRRAYVIVSEKRQFFPQRKLHTIEYSIEDTYQGLYEQLRGYLGKDRRQQPAQAPQDELTYARYGLWHYVRKDKQQEEPYQSLQRSGSNLRGLIRVMMFKRFESSVHAFRETVRRLLRVHEAFLRALTEGIVPAGEEAQGILYDSADWVESDLLSALRALSGKYDIADFDAQRLGAHVAHDIELLGRILALVEPIGPDRDAKLQTLLRKLAEPPLKQGKRLLFTQYTDTADYLYRNLNPAESRPDIAVVSSGDKNKTSVVRRFAPKANPELHWRAGETKLDTVIATDVLSEGLNLQDCDKIINYDLHWNPVRLIQRFGRIDRIGSEHDTVHGFNFLPEVGIEHNLGLKQTLQNRIQDIHDTIGEDSKILDNSEQLNEQAMFAIYEQGYVPEEEDDEYLNLNDAEEILRRLRQEDPALYERIAKLPDGVRAARRATAPGTFVFCEASTPGDSGKGYQQLFLVSDSGDVVTRDVPRILGVIKCDPNEEGVPLPAAFNEVVTRTRRAFAEEVKHRAAELQHTLSLTLGQRYVLRELRLLFATATNEDVKGQLNLLERAFRGPVSTPVAKELNQLRRVGSAGEQLLEALKRIYQQHNLREWLDRRGSHEHVEAVPRVVCSEAIL